jgi:serine/threonine protein kinase
MNIYLAMEYFENGTLQDYLKEKSIPIPEKDAKKAIIQLLRGIRVMHSEGYAHRDLKPSVG